MMMGPGIFGGILMILGVILIPLLLIILAVASGTLIVRKPNNIPNIPDPARVRGSGQFPPPAPVEHHFLLLG